MYFPSRLHLLVHRADSDSRLDEDSRDRLVAEDGRRAPLGSQRRPELVLVLSRTRVRERKVLEEVLGGLLVLLLADDDVREARVLALSLLDAGNLRGELLGVASLLDTLARPRTL